MAIYTIDTAPAEVGEGFVATLSDGETVTRFYGATERDAFDAAFDAALTTSETN